MQTVQFIQVTPEQLQDAIIEGVKTQLQDLKTHFQPKEPNEYLTRNEIAEMLKIDLSTVHNWTKRGTLQSYQIQGRVYYKRKEIEERLREARSPFARAESFAVHEVIDPRETRPVLSEWIDWIQPQLETLTGEVHFPIRP